ncbi:MAG: hypothetical protein KGN33_18230, partial [Paracoccaceae bacterium]|nr:hypothetical protein [Paracoccaceae bacterium]
NSYKSFVGSSNIKECFSAISINIWAELETRKGCDVKLERKRLDEIWRWRNRIAHEGDLVPSNATFSYWAIHADDVLEASAFLTNLANNIADVLECIG